MLARLFTGYSKAFVSSTNAAAHQLCTAPVQQAGPQVTFLPMHAGTLQGTIDGLLCKPTGRNEAEAAIRNIHNNLKSPGSLILFTHGPPSLRLPLLNTVAWESVSVKVIVPAAGGGGAAAAAAATAGTGGGPSKGKGKAAAACEGLNVLQLDEVADYPECASYVYVCKKPYV